MSLKITGSKDSFLVAQAVAFAIEAMSRMPGMFRPDNDIDALKEILSETPQREMAVLQGNAKRRVAALLGDAEPKGARQSPDGSDSAS